LPPTETLSERAQPFDLNLSKEVAVELSERLFVHVYGDGVLDRRPFVARAASDGAAWHVSGTFSGGSRRKGGVPELMLRKSDGAVLLMTHGE
jgi:hypothetical protein